MPAPGPILITFAVRNEAKPFLQLCPQTADLRVLLTGIGPDLASQNLTSALQDQHPSLVISSGFAGALNPNLKHGDILHDTSHAPQLEPVLAQLLSRPSRFLQSSSILTTPSQKQSAFKTSGADAVEMESQTILQICRKHQIPCTVLRVISDVASESLPPNMNLWLTPQGNPRPLQLAFQCLKSPTTILQLISLGRNSSRAAKRLASTLQSLTRTLPQCLKP